MIINGLIGIFANAIGAVGGYIVGGIRAPPILARRSLSLGLAPFLAVPCCKRSEKESIRARNGLLLAREEA